MEALWLVPRRPNGWFITWCWGSVGMRFFFEGVEVKKIRFPQSLFWEVLLFLLDKEPGKRWNATRLQIDLANRSCEYNTENIHQKMTFDRCFPLRILYIFKENLDLLCWFVIGHNSSSRTLLTMSKMVVSLPKRRFRLCSPSLKVWESWCSYSVSEGNLTC